MAICKNQADQKEWSIQIREGHHVGAAMLVASTRASIEVAQYQGQCTLIALVKSSNCCEHVGHALAGERVVASGLHDGCCHLQRQSSCMCPWGGGLPSQRHGLEAGCAFAKDLLKAFIGRI